jgi:excisionase family DNA binding protein
MTTLWTVKETAEQLRVSERTLHTWTAEGLLPSVRLGGRVLYRPGDVETLVEKSVSTGKSAECEAAE